MVYLTRAVDRRLLLGMRMQRGGSFRTKGGGDFKGTCQAVCFEGLPLICNITHTGYTGKGRGRVLETAERQSAFHPSIHPHFHLPRLPSISSISRSSPRTLHPSLQLPSQPAHQPDPRPPPPPPTSLPPQTGCCLLRTVEAGGWRGGLGGQAGTGVERPGASRPTNRVNPGTPGPGGKHRAARQI